MQNKENGNVANIVRTQTAATGGGAIGQHSTLMLRQGAHSIPGTGTTEKATPAPRTEAVSDQRQRYV